MSGGNNSSGFSEQVHAVLFERIENYEQLELLLFLRSDAARGWTVTLAAERLSIAADAARTALEHLSAKGIVAMRGSNDGTLFHYEPRDAELRAAIDALAHAYEERRIEVMRVMNANAIERVRTAAIRTFADAFVFRRKDG